MILLTGASGFMGRHVLSHLLEKYNSSEIYVLINKNESPLLEFKQYKLNFIRGGLKNICNVKNIEPNSIETIIHLASKNKDSDNTGFDDTNIIGTCNLVEFAHKFKVHNIIYSSSTGVYGHQNIFQVTENFPKNPDSEFSKSKYIAEKIIKKSNLKTLILRHRFIIGEGDKFVIPGYLGALKKLPFRINNNEAFCSFIEATDLAKLIIYFCQEGLSKQSVLNQEIHITNGEDIQISRLYSILSQKLNIPHKTYFNISGNLLYKLLLLYEKVFGIDPEINNGLNSLRVKFLSLNNHISNKKLVSLVPGFKFQKLEEILENCKNYYSNNN